MSQLVKTYCGNSFVDFVSNDKTEVFNVDYSSHIVQLTESPVISVTSVEERSSYSSAYTVLTTASNEYYLDLVTDSIFRTTGSSFKEWPLGPGAVRIVYKAGYTTGVPEDLKLAVIDLITYYFKDQYKEQRVLGDASITNKGSSTLRKNIGFPDHIKRILDLHKQI